MQFQPQGKPSVGIVFDADLGNTIDDALALAMLFGFQGKNESRVLSVSTTKSSLQRRHLRRRAGPLLHRRTRSVRRRHADRPLRSPARWPRRMRCSMPSPAMQSTPRNIVKMNDTADPLALIRNALSAQFDQNAIVVLTGPATNLAGSSGASRQPGVDRAKSANAGDRSRRGHDERPPRREARVGRVAHADRGGRERTRRRLPVSRRPASRRISPGRRRTRWWRPIAPTARCRTMLPAVAMAAALYAVRPQENYFKVSEPGALTVADDGAIRLAPAAGGKHRTLIADPAQKDRIQQIYAETASTKPVGRAQRFRPPQKKQ